MNEVRTSLAIIMVLALDYLLRHWNPRLRYALWLVVLFQALWPPTFRIPVFTVWSATPVQLLPTGFVAGSSSAAVLPGGINSTVWILALWGAASVLVILWMITAFISLRGKLRHAQPMPAPPLTGSKQPGRRVPTVLFSDRIHSPLTIGLFRPRIYLNTAAARIDEAALRAILHHELAHIVRRDRWIISLQALALILHPFNPLVWIMNRRLARYREQVCDDIALRQTGIAPVAYGHLLLDYVALGALCRPALLPRTLFCESRNDLRQRLTQLLSRKETTMNRTSIMQKMSLVAILLAMAFISSQCQEESNALTLQEQHDRQAALTDASPEFVPEGSSGLTEEEEKKLQASLTGPVVEFIPYDVPPKPIGGYAALATNVRYSDIAKEAGIEGTAIIQAYVDSKGRVQHTKVLKGIPYTGLDEAAADAVRRTGFEPAKHQGKNVGVWISIPINFRLDDKPSPVKEKD
jgi:TonB family protein